MSERGSTAHALVASPGVPAGRLLPISDAPGVGRGLGGGGWLVGAGGRVGISPSGGNFFEMGGPI